MHKKLLIASLLWAALGGALSSHDARLQSCTAKARAYYRSIGSYPTFSSGIDAEFVAHEHCSRSPELFDDLSYIQPAHARL